MKILILEDDRSLLDLLTRRMAEYGECYATDNGIDAVRAFDEAMVNQDPFELALLDIMLPGMSGYEVLEKIRQIEAQWKKDGLEGATVIMVTALNTSKDILQAFRGNCEAYMTKPYTKKDLEQILTSLGIKKQSKQELSSQQ